MVAYGVGRMLTHDIIIHPHEKIGFKTMSGLDKHFGKLLGATETPSLSFIFLHLQVTSTAQIVPQVGAAVGDVTFLMLVGYSYQQYGPYIIWSYQLVLCGSMCAVAWVMQVIGSLHGDRYKDSKP